MVLFNSRDISVRLKVEIDTIYRQDGKLAHPPYLNVTSLRMVSFCPKDLYLLLTESVVDVWSPIDLLHLAI